MPSAAAARWRLSGGGDGSCRPIASVVLAGVVLAVDDPRVPEPKLLTDLLKVVDGGDQLTKKRVGIERRRDVSGRVRERTSVVKGKSVSVSVDLGGRRHIK